MIELSDVEQMTYLFGIRSNVTTAGTLTIFEFSMFGTKIIFLDKNTTWPGTGDDSWRIVYISPSDTLEEKRMEVIWTLMSAGYMHYLRIEVPRTFKEMIISHGWDKKIVEKRLEIYGDDPKYNYWRDLNKWSLKHPATYVLATDPGFFDFLPN